MKDILKKLWIFIIGIIFVGMIVVMGYIALTYGDKPITEIPAWVLWFMG